ncbi:MAG TPA: hypothetical protein PKY12_11520, partial [Catalimonadaceae bacterium]|nr:hypothetical protein [Catalimonadaceae bacterium]
MKILLAFLGLILVFSRETTAQNSNLKADSSLRVLLVQPSDSNLVKALNNLGVQYELSDSAFAEKVYLKALSLSKQLKNPKLECKSLTNLGILYKTYNNLPVAGRYQQLNLSVAEKAGLVLEKGKALVNLGNVYNAGNQNSKALATYLKAVTYLEKAGDQRALSLTLGNIAHLYSDQSEYQISLKYAAQALEAGMRCGNANAIGSAYHNASYSLFHLNLLDSSYGQTMRAIPYLKQAGNSANLQAMYVNAAS